MRILFSGEAGTSDTMISMNKQAAPNPIGMGDYIFAAVVGTITGLLLWGFTETEIDKAYFPYGLVVFSTALLLTWMRGAHGPSTIISLALGLITGGTMFLLEQSPSPDSAFNAAIFWGIPAAPLLCYVSIGFLKSWLDAGNRWPSYSYLFDNKIRLPIQLFFAELFGLLLFGLVWLWAWMFEAIEIKFFMELLDEEYFVLPFFGFAFGLSLMLIRGWDGFVTMWKNLGKLFSRFAMPLVALFTLSFLGALIFTGLDPLWSTPTAAGTSGAIAIVLILLVNGVRQDGMDGLPPTWLRFSTLLTLATIPAYAAISAWAVWLRVDQYGFTPERFIFTGLTLILLGHGLVLLLSVVLDILGLRRPWLPLMSPLNMISVWVLSLFFCALVTPLADPLKISTESQLERYTSGEVSREDFDFTYFWYRLGEPGRNAVRQLSAAEANPDGHFTMRIDLAKQHHRLYGFSSKERALSDYQAVINDEKSIYQINLPVMRFDAGNFGKDLVKTLSEIENHKDAELIRKEAGHALSLGEEQKFAYRNEWFAHSTIEAFKRGEITVQEINFTLLLHRRGEPGKAAIEELRAMTDHPEYDEILKQIEKAEAAEDPADAAIKRPKRN